MATYDVKQIALPGGDIANLKDGNAIHKSSTSGFVKNDGSIDQNTYQIAQEGKGLSTNDFTNEDKALIGQTLGNNAVLTTDKTPFLTRQTLNPTGFSGYVREKLVGASYAWNQLVPDGNITDTTKWQCTYGTFTISGNVATITCTTAGNVIFSPTQNIPTLANHKYYVCAIVKSINGRICLLSTAYHGTEPSTTSTSFTKLEWISYRSSDFSGYFPRVVCQNMAVGEKFEVKLLMCIDLTLAFGSTIADYLYGLSNNGGITKLRDMGCPIDKYTPYGYGLYSVKTSGKLIRGFNQWDEVWESGDINNATGENTPNSGTCRSKNYIRVFGDVTYYCKGNLYIHHYDAGKNHILSYANKNNTTYTIPSNCAYIRFVYVGTTYNNDICINISDTNKNGQYEPYCGYEISLGNDELRGKFDLVNGEIVASGDVKESNGEIARNYGIVDLGTLTWINDGNGIFRCNNFNANAKPATTYSGVANIIAEKYTAGGWGDVYDSLKTNTICYRQIATNDNRLAVVSGTSSPTGYMIFELITPTTEQSTPFADPMSMVGATTEEYIDDRDIPCPVGAERQYMGQSEDIVEIPSNPQSDGKRVLVAETNNGNTVNYFGDLSLLFEDVSSKITKYYDTTVTNFIVLYAYKIGKLVSFSFRATISGDGYGRLATFDKSLVPKNYDYFLFNSITTTQGNYNLRGYFTGRNLNVAGLDSSTSIDLVVSATYITAT